MEDMTNMTGKDNAKSWMLLSVVTLSFLNEVGTVKALSVLLPDIKEQLETRTWIVGSSIAIVTAFGCLLGLSSGVLVKSFSPRAIVMSSGFIATIGLIVCSIASTPFTLLLGLILTGFVFLQINVLCGMVPEHFDKYYETAVAIYGCGTGLAIIIYPIVTQALLDIYGWRGALLILSGISFHTVPLGAVLGPGKIEDRKTYQSGVYEQLFDPENSSTEEKTKENEFLPKRTFRKVYRAFGLTIFTRFSFTTEVLIPAMVNGYTIVGWMIYMVSYAVSVGLTIKQGSVIATSGGIGIFLLRMSLPLCHKCVTYRQLMYFSSALMALSLSLTTVFDDYVTLNMLAIIYGVGIGILGIELHISAKENCDESEYYYAFAWYQWVWGMSTILSGVVTGIFYDATDSFTISFNLLAGMSLATAMSLGLTDLLR